MDWFASCGFACPAQYNPADFFADVVAADHRSHAAEQQSARRIALLVERFRKRQGQEAAQVSGARHASTVLAGKGSRRGRSVDWVMPCWKGAGCQAGRAPGPSSHKL